MENSPQAETNKKMSPEEKTFFDYIKDFSLTDEDLQKSILDVGSGNGNFIKYIREKLGNQHAFGLEKEAGKIKTKFEGIVFADGFEMPFADNTFEIIVSRNFIPMFAANFKTSEMLFRELIRVLKPGGKLIGNIPTPNSELEELKKEVYENDSDFKKFFDGRYRGALQLEEHLKQLGYPIEYKRSGDRDIILLTKP